MVKSFYFILLTVLLSTSLFGQDVKEEMNKIAERYKNLKHFSMQIKMELFPKFNSTVPIEEQNMWVARSGENFSTKMPGTFSLANDHYELGVDDESKLITIQKRKAKKVLDASSAIKINFDSLLSSIDSSDVSPHLKLLNKNTNGLRVIKIDSDFGEYESYLIYYNNKYIIEKIVMFYSTALPILSEDNPAKPKIVMSFIDFNESPSLAPNLFSESAIISVNGNKVKGIGKYSEYKIVNLLNFDITVSSQH